MTGTLSTEAGRTARQVMSSPVYAMLPRQSLAEAHNLMHTRGIRHVVVVVGDHPVGILDERTLVAHWPAGGPDAAWSVTISSVVDSGTCCVDGDAPIAVIAELMCRTRVDAVPVVTPGGTLIGLVTAGDLVAALAGVGRPAEALSTTERPVGTGM